MNDKGNDSHGSLHDELDTGECILLLSPSLHAATEEACLDLLALDDPREQNVLWVTYTRSPEACVQDWRADCEAPPAGVQFVDVGETTRSASAAAASSGADADFGLGEEAVASLANPGDLTGLGIKLSEVLKEWSGAPERTVACFDSLTALLQYADLQTVYKFLHVLTGRFETADVTAHFHLDPDACDQQTVSTLTTLFDTVVELDDGEWAVRSR
jgi:hypothetical protein